MKFMKKISVLFMFLLVAAVTFVGCKKDEDVKNGPTITFSGADSKVIDYAITGDNRIVFNVDVAAEGEIGTFTITKKVVGTSTQTSTIAASGYDGQTSWTYNFDQTIAETEFATGVTKIEYVFSVQDKQKSPLGNEKTFTVTKKAAPVETPFTYTKTGQFYHIAGALKGAYDLDGDVEVASTGTASAKSMKNTDAAGSAFTGTWTSDVANGTTYVIANTYAYATATVESAATAFATGSASATVTNPAANNIYIAKKGASTYYVIKVVSVDPAFSTGTGGNTGKISFEYKKM